MDLYVSDKRIYALDDGLTPERAKEKAEELKTKAFGMLSGLIMGAKREDIDVTYVERRWEPYWHIACKTHLEYNRLREYAHRVDDEVKTVAVDGKTYTSPLLIKRPTRSALPSPVTSPKYRS